MTQRTTRFVVLNSYANGTALSESHFSLESKTLAPLAEAEVLLQTLVLSPDPYMRGRMTGVENFFLPQFELRAPLVGFGVARILESRNPAFQAGCTTEVSARATPGSEATLMPMSSGLRPTTAC